MNQSFKMQSFCCDGDFLNNPDSCSELDYHSLFSCDELDILRKYGAAFHALTSGERMAITAAEDRFLRAVRGQKNPSDIKEKTWIKYLGLIDCRTEKYDVSVNLFIGEKDWVGTD